MSAVILSLSPDADASPAADRRADFGRPPRLAVARRLVDSWASLTWTGLALAAAGLGCIAWGWYRVAREGEVYRQVPYVVSAGLTGLALVLAGATAVNIAARQRDTTATDEQIDRLIDTVETLASRLPATASARPREGWALVGGRASYPRPTAAFRGSLAFAAALVVGGLAAITVAWYGVATTRIVSHQMPYLLSGGLVGLALVAVGLVVFNAQARGWAEAVRRERIERAVDAFSAGGEEPEA